MMRILIILGLSFLLFACDKTVENDGLPSRDNALNLGLPTAAGSNPNDYLLEKAQFAMSYHRDKGRANWVAWHLSTAWRGDAERSSSFRIDPDLPQDWTLVRSEDYTNTGFDRGHLCPSEDRDGSAEDNQATFVMSNVLPQAPACNRGPWAALEAYVRTQVDQGMEAYIFAGPKGQGGEGSNGTANSIASNRIEVPASVWKIIVLLPAGSNDLDRIDENTRIIAVDIPNNQSVSGQAWSSFRVSVDQLEADLNMDFFKELSNGLQAELESRVDDEAI